MNKCQECGSTSKALVMSGIDALILGVDTETVCYDCAPYAAKRKREAAEAAAYAAAPKCGKCYQAKALVMSGVDAFVLGVQVGEVCYDCANAKATV